MNALNCTICQQAPSVTRNMYTGDTTIACECIAVTRTRVEHAINAWNLMQRTPAILHSRLADEMTIANDENAYINSLIAWHLNRPFASDDSEHTLMDMSDRLIDTTTISQRIYTHSQNTGYRCTKKACACR